MDRESESNFTEENSFSMISTEEMMKMNSYSNFPNNSFQNFGSNAHFANGNRKIEYDNWNWMNQSGVGGAAYSRDKLKEICMQFNEYLRFYSPDLIKLFNYDANGDVEEDYGRRTPLHFSDNHAICQLNFPGLIYHLVPNAIKSEGGMILISDEILPKLYDTLIDDYPGPLTVERTTEEQIYSYLRDQMCLELQDTSPIDWDSGHLLINYLELMIKENGKPRIGNIVRLLNEGVETKTAELRKDSKLIENVYSRNSFSRASSRATSRASSRPCSPTNIDNIDPDLPQDSIDTPPPGPGSVTSMVRRAVAHASSDQRMCQNMDRFRQYIVTGRFEEAVHFATKAGIWDHAFALALRLSDTQLINEVLVSFSRHAIYSNDPLFTMHELMASRPPRIAASNRGFSNNEMGDWRCHLGMILAVKKYRSEECRQAIEAMGEKLSALRSYYAAHLCYLLAGTPFGLDKTTSRYRRKYDLIGWQSSTSSIPAQKSTQAYCMKLFTGLNYWRSAPEQSIKLTEIYEYAMKLSSDHRLKSVSVHLLPYKYLMVYKMISRNQIRKAYEYCTNIGEILGYEGFDWIRCESINFRIISNVNDLSSRLNSWLTTNEDSSYSNRNTTWLSNINKVYKLFCKKYNFWNEDFFQKPDFSQVKSTNDDKTFGHLHPEEVFSNEMNNYSYSESVGSSLFVDRQQLNQSDRNFNQYNIQRTPMHNSRGINNPNRSGFPNDPRVGIRSNFPNNQESLTGQIYDNQVRSVQPNNRNMLNKHEQLNFIPPESVNPHNSSYPSSRQSEYVAPNDLLSQSQSFQSSQMMNQSEFSVQQNQYPPKTKTVNQSFTKPNFDSTSFREIAPPSELPNEAIMTEPPRFNDNKMQSGNPNVMNKQVNAFAESHKSLTSNYQQSSYKFNHDESTMSRKVSMGSVNANIGDDYHSKPTMPGSLFIGNLSANTMPFDESMASKKPTMGNLNANTGDDYHSKSNSSHPYISSNVDHNPNKSTFQAKQPTFIPSRNDIDPDEDSPDCFVNYPSISRSRSQSNGSVGSNDQAKQPQYQIQSRSRNNSESKDSIPPSHQSSASRTLEPTKEENDTSSSTSNEKVKAEPTEGKLMNFFRMFKSAKQKEIYLPNDNDKSLVYDKDKQEWIDTLNPESKKSITPPPILPATANLNDISSPDPYQVPQMNQFAKTRYRPAAVNVKPSATVAMPPPNPTFIMSQNMGDTFSRPNADENNSQMCNSNYGSSPEYGYGGPDMSSHYYNNYNDQIYVNHMNYHQPITNPRNI